MTHSDDCMGDRVHICVLLERKEKLDELTSQHSMAYD